MMLEEEPEIIENGIRLSDAEKREFDNIGPDTIQAITDLPKLQKMERYYRLGGFPPTAQAVLKRMAELGLKDSLHDPELDKEASKDLEGFRSTLKSWTAEVKLSDQELSAMKSQGVAYGAGMGAPPPRPPGTISVATVKDKQAKPADTAKDQTATQAKQQAKPDSKFGGQVRSGSDYYQKWDQFASQAEAAGENEDEDQPIKPSVPSVKAPAGGTAPGATAGSGASGPGAAQTQHILEANAGLVPKERAFLAEQEKSKGNDCFRAKEYPEAVERYTLSVGYNGSSAGVYGNRAAAYFKLKMFKEVVQDCDSALALDKGYLKGYVRRAAAHMELGQADKAMQDIESGLALDPGHKELAIMQQRAAKALGLSGMKRMAIQEVEDEDDEDDIDEPVQGPGQGLKAPTQQPPARVSNPGTRTRITVVEETDSEDDEPSQESKVAAQQSKESKAEAQQPKESKAVVPPSVLPSPARPAARKTKIPVVEEGSDEEDVVIKPTTAPAQESAAPAVAETPNAGPGAAVAGEAKPAGSKKTAAKKAAKAKAAAAAADQAASSVPADAKQATPAAQPVPAAPAAKPVPTTAPKPFSAQTADAPQAPAAASKPSPPITPKPSVAPPPPVPSPLTPSPSVFAPEPSLPARPPPPAIVTLDQEFEELKAQGNKAFKALNSARAIDLYSKAIQLLPDSAIAHSNRAAAKLQAKDPKGGLQDACLAVALDPSYAKGMTNRAKAKMELRLLQAAKGDLDVAAGLVKGKSGLEKDVAELHKDLEKLLQARQRERDARKAQAAKVTQYEGGVTIEEHIDEEDEDEGALLTPAQVARIQKDANEQSYKAKKLAVHIRSIREQQDQFEDQFEDQSVQLAMAAETAAAVMVAEAMAAAEAQSAAEAAEVDAGVAEQPSAESHAALHAPTDRSPTPAAAPAQSAPTAPSATSEPSKAAAASKAAEPSKVAAASSKATAAPSKDAKSKPTKKAGAASESKGAASKVEPPKAAASASGPKKLPTEQDYKELGNQRFAKGDLPGACKAWQRALSMAKPGSQVALACHSNLARAQLELEDPQGALDSADQVLKFEAGHAKALHRRAQALFLLNRLEDADAAYRQLLKHVSRKEDLEPELERLQAALARQCSVEPLPGVDTEELKKQQARQAFGQATAPSAAAPAPAQGTATASPPAAAAVVMPARTKVPIQEEADQGDAPVESEQDVTINLAPSAAAHQGPGAGAPPAEGLKSATPSSSAPEVDAAVSDEQERILIAEKHRIGGNEHFKNQQYAFALRAYELSLQVYPTALSYTNKALVLLKLDRPAEAVEACRAALVLEPGQFKAQHRLAKALMAMGQFEEAVPLLEKVSSQVTSKDVLDELATARAGLATQQRQAAPASSSRPTAPTRHKIQIQETNSSESDEDEPPPSEATTGVPTTSASAVSNTTPAATPRAPPRVTASPTASNGAGSSGSSAGGSAELGASGPERRKASPGSSTGSSSSIRLHEAAAAKATAASVNLASKRPTPPRSAVDFANGCKLIGSDNELLAEYVTSIDPSTYPALFKQSLDNVCLSHMLRALGHIAKSDPEFALQALSHLPSVGRFSMVVAMLGRPDKAVLSHMLATAEAAGLDTQDLRSKYKL